MYSGCGDIVGCVGFNSIIEGGGSECVQDRNCDVLLTYTAKDR